jgi:hypothetical protein
MIRVVDIGVSSNWIQQLRLEGYSELHYVIPDPRLRKMNCFLPEINGHRMAQERLERKRARALRVAQEQQMCLEERAVVMMVSPHGPNHNS